RLGRAGGRERDHAPAEAGEEVDAREAGPLAVGLEQLRGLPRLHDLSSGERAHELDQAEVAHETVLHATEPLETDDAGRPRAQPALALDSPDDRLRRQVVEALELEAATEPDDGRAAALVQPEAAQLERRGRGERGGGRRLGQAALVRPGQAPGHGSLETS